ncbi:MAG: aminoacyl-tRNA deacylase [Vicinamibacterales bacterium]
MPPTLLIHEFLHQARVPYTVLPHPPAYSAQEEAAATHVSGRDWAKVVACFVDGRPIEAVLPATSSIDLERLAELARGEIIRLAREDELVDLFPGCEEGAIPPFGPLYALDVYVDVSLAGEAEIAFSAGSHSEAIQMRWADFVSSVRPIVGRFAVPIGH